MTAKARGQFAAKKLQRLSSLIQKIVGRLHNEPARVLLPSVKNVLIDSLGLRRRFGSQRVEPLHIERKDTKRNAQSDHDNKQTGEKYKQVFARHVDTIPFLA